jgi:hypothetical protein
MLLLLPCAYLLQALNLSLSSCTLHTPATSRARLRLLQLVRSIIQSEAACSTAASMRPLSIAAAAAAATTPDLESALQLVSPRLAPASPPASLAELRATPAAVSGADSNSNADAASCKDNPLQDALAGGGWEHAARAPLVVAALKVLSGLQGNDYKHEVVQLFPALCRLVCSNHMLTRQALHQVFSSREFVELLPAAAAVAVAVAANDSSGSSSSRTTVGPVGGAQSATGFQDVLL